MYGQYNFDYLLNLSEIELVFHSGIRLKCIFTPSR